MNEVLKVISERYSCRSYEDRLPEREKLDAIALAAVQSPSGMNRQPWRIIVVTDKGLIDEMDAEAMRIFSLEEDKTWYNRMMERGGKVFYGAPCVYVILMQPEKDLDCGIVSENIALAAAALGLGNCICGLFRVPLNGPKGEDYKKRLGFEDGFEFGMSVLVGYAAEADTPHAPDLSKIKFLESGV